MKSKDLVALLQKVDPTGEGYVIIGSGVITHAEVKEGYYDGPYTYIDSDTNFVTSIKGYKVDIGTIDLDEFVWNRVNVFDPDSLSKIKSKFKFELDGYLNKGEDRKSAILKEVETQFDWWYNSQMKSKLKWALNFIQTNSEKVYYFTPRAWTTHHKHGEWEVHHNGKITHGMNGGDIDTVYNMGLFDTTVVEGKHFKYVFNKEKSDNYIKTFFKDFIDQPDNE